MKIAAHRLQRDKVYYSARWFLACILVVQFADYACAQAVRLAWDHVPDSSIVGYNVYRSEQSGVLHSIPVKRAASLNVAQLITTTSFTDSTVRRGRTYFYAVTSVAADGSESPHSDEIQAVISPLQVRNQAPKVDAGPDQTVDLSAGVVLAATVADDGLPNGSAIYEWSVVSGDGVVFGTPASASTRASFSRPGTYTLKVAVSDGELSSSDDVVVVVNSAFTAGFVRVQPGPNGAPPSGLGIVEISDDGELVSEAAFPGSPLVQSGRIYAETGNSVDTGIAIANPNAEWVTLEFYFTDARGLNIHSGKALIEAGGGITAFLSAPPFAPGDPAQETWSEEDLTVFQGESSTPVNVNSARTFTFSSSLPIAFTAVRAFVNEESQLLMTPLPVAQIDSADDAPLGFAYYVEGGGWKTELQLVNPTDSVLSGAVEFFPNSDISHPKAHFSYEIPPRSAVTLGPDKLASGLRTGWARLTPLPGTPNPASLLILSFHSAGATAFYAGIPGSSEAPAFRVHASRAVLAISNPAPTEAELAVEIFSAGVPAPRRGVLTVPASAQIMVFTNQIPGLEGIDVPVDGFLRISGPPVFIIGFKERHGEHGDRLVIPIPAAPEPALTAEPEEVFLFFAEGHGFETQFNFWGLLRP